MSYSSTLNAWSDDKWYWSNKNPLLQIRHMSDTRLEDFIGRYVHLKANEKQQDGQQSSLLCFSEMYGRQSKAFQGHWGPCARSRRASNCNNAKPLQCGWMHTRRTENLWCPSCALLYIVALMVKVPVQIIDSPTIVICCLHHESASTCHSLQLHCVQNP